MTMACNCGCATPDAPADAGVEREEKELDLKRRLDALERRLNELEATASTDAPVA